eukprot:4697623-Pyramimonas_sp.AAC.1
MECWFIDPGARDILVGDHWVERQGKLARGEMPGPMRTEMDEAIGAEGVGARAQIARGEIEVPGAAKMRKARRIRSSARRQWPPTPTSRPARGNAASSATGRCSTWSTARCACADQG